MADDYRPGAPHSLHLTVAAQNAEGARGSRACHREAARSETSGRSDTGRGTADECDQTGTSRKRLVRLPVSYGAVVAGASPGAEVVVDVEVVVAGSTGRTSRITDP